MSRITIAIIAGLMLGGVLMLKFTTPGTNENDKVIRFATDASYPPFEFVDDSGQLKGYDIDIAKAACKQMNATCTFSNRSYDSLITGLNEHKYDAIIAVSGANGDSRHDASYTDVAYSPTIGYIAPVDRHYTAGDIIGKTIAVQKNSPFEKYLTEKYGKAVTIKTYDDINAALQDMQAGHVDMALGDAKILKGWLGQNDNAKNYVIIVGPVITRQYFGSGFGIGVRKDDMESLNALNRALIEIKENGMYDRITRKYFGS